MEVAAGGWGSEIEIEVPIGKSKGVQSRTPFGEDNQSGDFHLIRERSPEQWGGSGSAKSASSQITQRYRTEQGRFAFARTMRRARAKNEKKMSRERVNETQEEANCEAPAQSNSSSRTGPMSWNFSVSDASVGKEHLRAKQELWQET